MKKRDLADILREVQKEGVKEPETIRRHICTLGNRTLYSLMYGDKERCSEEEGYECWSHLEFVLQAYACLSEFTDEQTAYCMKHITFRDFLCLVDHLNDQNIKLADSEGGGILRNDFGMEHMQEIALGYLLKLILRAKGRGDKDVNNFCMIHVDSMLAAIDENVGKDASVQKKGSDQEVTDQKNAGANKKNKLELIIDGFYVVKDRLDLDNESWTNLDIGNKEVEFGCIRELLVNCMKDFDEEENFSLSEVLEKCKIMCRKMNMGKTMLSLKCRTRENSDLDDRAKVYFTCHPDDFNRTFDKLCEDIFRTHDCGVYYTENRSEEALREKPDEFLTDMNLFVIPVTSRLLSEKDSAVDMALSYARRERMPILPILMEAGVAEVYSRDERFRDLPYIDSCEQDDSGLGYEKRLYWHLNIFLDALTVCDSIYGKAGNEEPAERIIRAAEKGNAGAMENCEMMYWFGIGVPQDWQKAIEWGEKCVDRTIEVMGEEHPAVRCEMKSLIRICSEAGDNGKALRLERKLDMILCKTVISEEDLSTRAETNMEIEEGEMWYDFLRGAYGFQIWDTLREMKWLVHLYGITGDYEKAIELGKSHGACRGSNVESPYLIIVQGWLVHFYCKTQNCEKGIELGEWVLAILCRSFGEKDPFTQQVMEWLLLLADAYDRLGEHKKALELMKK